MLLRSAAKDRLYRLGIASHTLGTTSRGRASSSVRSETGTIRDLARAILFDGVERPTEEDPLSEEKRKVVDGNLEVREAAKRLRTIGKQLAEIRLHEVQAWVTSIGRFSFSGREQTSEAGQSS